MLDTDDSDQNNPNYTNNNNTLSGYSGLQTVKQNMEGFTKRQVDRANKARAAFHMGGALDMEKFKLAIRAGFFKNCGVTEEDLSAAEAIYGPSVSLRKGKHCQPTPPGVENDWIELPPELYKFNQELDLCVDLTFINNAILLTGIDKQVKNRECVDLPTRTKSALYNGIDTILRVYNLVSFKIRTIYCDSEFATIFDPVKDEMDVHMNYSSPGEHEPTAERNNQTFKALFRTQYHRMPYKAIPKVLTVHLAKRVTSTMNYYPAKGGISSHYSPHMIMKKRTVNFATNFVAECGAYVQGYGHETHRN